MIRNKQTVNTSKKIIDLFTNYYISLEKREIKYLSFILFIIS